MSQTCQEQASLGPAPGSRQRRWGDAFSACAGPKTRRKSLARNLPSLLAANAVIVFTGHLPAGMMLSFCEETGRRNTGASTLPSPERSPLVLAGGGTFWTGRYVQIELQVGPERASLHRCSLPLFFVHRRDEPTYPLPRRCRRLVVRSRPCRARHRLQQDAGLLGRPRRLRARTPFPAVCARR